MKKSILVTGGSGLLGRALADEVEKDERMKNLFEFIFLSSRDADLTDLSQTLSIFDKYQPSYVINLAAKVGGLYANMFDNETFYEVNLKINENVLSCSSKYKVKKCISCLSTCIFPASIFYPLDESKVSELWILAVS